jgi:glycopeptide antibiotics resistance protein
VAAGLLVAYLLVPLVLTLSPQSPEAGLDGFYALVSRVVDRLSLGRTEVSRTETEALANVLLFVPVGLLLRLAVPRVLTSVLLAAAALASLAIEVTQYVALAGRDPSLVDVLTNTGGAAIGLVLGADVERILIRRRPDPT